MGGGACIIVKGRGSFGGGMHHEKGVDVWGGGVGGWGFSRTDAGGWEVGEHDEFKFP